MEFVSTNSDAPDTAFECSILPIWRRRTNVSARPQRQQDGFGFLDCAVRNDTAGLVRRRYETCHFKVGGVKIIMNGYCSFFPIWWAWISRTRSERAHFRHPVQSQKKRSNRKIFRRIFDSCWTFNLLFSRYNGRHTSPTNSLSFKQLYFVTLVPLVCVSSSSSPQLLW